MITIGCDHGGFRLKEDIKTFLEEMNVDFMDLGCYNELSCDYPDIAKAVCQNVVDGTSDKAILICGTGIGMSIAANKIHGIRAAVCSDEYSVRYTRLHNDSNVLCLGARVIGSGIANEIVDIFLKTEFEGGRHKVRVDKIMELEH